MKEKVYEKYAWIILCAIGVITIIGGVPHALGINTDPAAVERISGMTLDELQDSTPRFYDLHIFYFQFGGWSDVAFAFFITAISLTAYRKGEKWAWYALWFVPAYFIGAAAITMRIDPSISNLLPIMIFVILGLLGLLLPYRKFFPSKADLKA